MIPGELLGEQIAINVVDPVLEKYSLQPLPRWVT
jgi:hypothetical protein